MNNDKTLISNHRICAMEANVVELVKEHPPRFSSPNKLFLYNLHAHAYPYSGELSYSRWKEMPLPNNLTQDMKQCTQLEYRPDIYTYHEPDTDTEMHWYLNFSHYILFAAYKGSLFAQDEIQVAEHPVLGSLYEALQELSRDSPEYTGITVQNSRPTPVLIQGAERRIHVELNKSGIYGNKFAKASTDQIQQATTILNPPTVSNIIAMEAPNGRFGYYRQETVEYILSTAYTGFRAAKIESNERNVQCIVNTGHWGSGAYGGSRCLMALLQIISAMLAGVDKLVYHTFSDELTADYLKAADIVKSFFEDESVTSIPMSKVIDLIMEMGFQWGVSDGN
jgi:hypothetical protein